MYHCPIEEGDVVTDPVTLSEAFDAREEISEATRQDQVDAVKKEITDKCVSVTAKVGQPIIFPPSQ